MATPPEINASGKKILRGVTPLPPRMVLAAPKVDYRSGGVDADVSFEVSGLEALAINLRSMPKFARDAAGIEMSDIAHEIIDLARDEFVPKKTWALHDSGDADEYLPDTVNNPEITEIKMWFGAPLSEKAKTESGLAIAAGDIAGVKDPSEYAWIQHEDFNLHHPNGGMAKYLEIPFDLYKDSVPQRIGEAIAKSWGGT